ncbi:MAG TPA: 30S ribosomal protein S20 [bacterium]|nr:30S ribosomal protein S20 [bacterium]
MGTKRYGKKRHRQSLKRRERNRAVRSTTRGAVKKAVAAAAGPPEEATEAQRRAQRIIDVAARKGVLHKRTAARKKSRLARLIRKAAPQEE